MREVAGLGDGLQLSQLLAQILRIGTDHPQIQDLATKKLREIVVQIHNEAEAPKAPISNKFQRCRAFQEIRAKLKQVGLKSIPVKDFRHLVHKVLLQSLIPDDPATNLLCDLYLKLDQYWGQVGPIMLAVVGEWINTAMNH
jgi:hypothetical protein